MCGAVRSFSERKERDKDREKKGREDGEEGEKDIKHKLGGKDPPQHEVMAIGKNEDGRDAEVGCKERKVGERSREDE